jgi:hypothetical protein
MTLRIIVRRSGGEDRSRRGVTRERVRRFLLMSRCRHVATIGLVALGLAVPASPASASTEHVAHAAAGATGSSTARRIDVGPGPDRAMYLRFRVGDLGGEVQAATLRVFKYSTAAAVVRVRRLTAGWSPRALRRGHRPALGMTIAGASAGRGRGWVDLDVTRAVQARKRLDLALVAPQRSRLQVGGSEARRGRTPRLRVETVPLSLAVPLSPPALAEPTPSTTPTPTATPEPVPTPTATHDYVPYDAASPWNTPIGDAAIHPDSDQYITAIADNGLPLTSDPDQYAIPVYTFDDDTPRRTVKLTGYFSIYEGDDWSRTGHGTGPTVENVPIPEGVTPSAGRDAHIVIWDPRAGIEYGFWQFGKDADGNYTATNGYRYPTTTGHAGRFADGLAGRGAGLPYLGGIVRKWEIEQGRIDHALAFAYDTPSAAFVFPASKSDGGLLDGSGGTELPEGTRLQLDPDATEADFDAWGLSAPARIIARALQVYGMYVVDCSGSSKIYIEDRITAGWDATITRDLVSAIPWDRFRAVEPPAR